MSRSYLRGVGRRENLRLAVPLALAALVGALFTPWGEGAASAAPSLAANAKNAAKLRGADVGSPIWKQTGAGIGDPGTANVPGLPKSGKVALMLELDTQSTAAAYEGSAAQGAAAARSAATGQLGRVKAMADSVRTAAPKVAPKTQVLYTSHSVMPGVAVTTDVSNVKALQSIPGVKAAHVIVPKTMDNAGAVPLIGGPDGWQAFPGAGQGVKLAVIDSGIDYTHADFGGPGTVAAYQQALATDTQPTNLIGPGKKVAGGVDLVGDDYNADPSDPAFQPVPHPDSNPLDCNAHGTHVAGSSVGLGVNADGSTYTGTYDANTPISSMRIGPGVAPKASLYSIRVFGCEGSTNVVGQAIDWAVDPNGDGDVSDHMDIVNLSLGSDFGSPEDSDSLAMNAAAKIGVTPVVASGNAGDLYNTGGSPGNAVRALTVAATDDGFAVVDGLHVDAPAAIVGDRPGELSVAYDYVTKPGVTNAEVAPKLSTGNEDGCAPLSAADAAKVAGKVAFLEWTDNDSTRRCGSAARALNVRQAGATGFIFANDEESFAAGITGDTDIPGMLISKSAGDAIRAQLGNGVHVTITNALHNKQNLNVPESVDTVASFSSRGVHSAGSAKPDIAAPGLLVFSAGVGTGNEGLTESGTSMATPMTAGSAALVKSKNPSWTPEEIKADLMNTAGADVFTGPNRTGVKQAPNRVGAGRVEVPPALSNQVLAMVTDDPGAVSVSFGPVAVSSPTSLTKTVKVVNKGSSTQTYAVGYQAITSVPGVSYTTSVSRVTVGPHGTASFKVSLRITNPKALTKTIDPAMETEQAGIPRQFIADASGRVVLHPTSGNAPELRVPVYAAPRPASTMTQSSDVTLKGRGIDLGTLRLSGRSVDQGQGAAHVQSLVSGYELLGTSGQVPACKGSATEGCVLFDDERGVDLKNVGATSDAPAWQMAGQDGFANGQLYFGINTWGAWRSPVTPNEFDVLIDTNGDKQADAILFSTRLSGTDIFVSALVDPAGNPLPSADNQAVTFLNVRPGDSDTDVYDSDSLVMSVPVAALPGLSSTNARIQFGVAAFDFYHNAPVDTVGVNPNTGQLTSPMTIDGMRPALMVGNATFDDVMVDDAPGNVTVREDVASFSQDHVKGLLMIHHHNATGSRAQVVKVRTKF